MPVIAVVWKLTLDCGAVVYQALRVSERRTYPGVSARCVNDDHGWCEVEYRDIVSDATREAFGPAVTASVAP